MGKERIVKYQTTLEDEIIYIFQMLEEKKITMDKSLLQTGFFEICYMTRFLKLSRLLFDGEFPYSIELENTLLKLEQNGILPHDDYEYDLSNLNSTVLFKLKEKNELLAASKILKKTLSRKY